MSMYSGFGKEGGPWPVHFAKRASNAASLLVAFWGNVRNQFFRDTFGFPCFFDRDTVALPLVEMDEVVIADDAMGATVDEGVGNKPSDEHSLFGASICFFK